MIQFLFGLPGTGKTHRMIEDIRSLLEVGEQRVYLLVPEQQIYSAERDILSTLPPNAASCFSILSFTRLCDEIESVYGGRTGHHVTKAMKAVLMWENLRQLKGITEVYSLSSASDVSLCRKMLQTAEDLRINAVSPVSLERVANGLPADAPLRGKLNDIALITAAYDGLISEVYGSSTADRMLRCAEVLDESRHFRDAVVFIDSFTSFTAQEYALLRPILRYAKDVTISFDCNGRGDRQPQFDSMRDSVRRITRLCDDLGQIYTDVLLNEDKRGLPVELEALSHELWDFDIAKNDRIAVDPSEQGHIRLVSAPNRYEEAKAAILHILELVESGVKYGEIAVVVRDVPTWKGILDATLEDYGIPYFLSDRTDIQEKPAARLLLSALRCVAKGWQREDILTLCKTGLLGIPMRDLDYFQEYVETWQLSGKRMTDNGWSMNPDGYKVEMSQRALTILQAANRVREQIMTPLNALSLKLSTAETVADQCRALYDYMMDLGVRERLADLAEKDLEQDRVREAGETVRLWSFLTETLATISAAFSETQPFTPDELSAVLSMMFSETDIGSVPALHDCVTVGSAATLRVDGMKAVLVLGLCEGEFPGSMQNDGLLSDQDKDILLDHGIELSGRAQQLMSDELLYLWRTVSWPSEYLFLSYSLSTLDGGAQAPSAAFNRVRYLFPYLKVIPFSTKDYDLSKPSDRYRTATEDRIARPTVRSLLGETIWLSQSKLQAYSRCPYSYYGSQILSLRGRQEATFDNVGAGVFLHHVMEKYLSTALDGENRIKPLEPQESEAIADAIISAYMEELCGDVSRNGRILHLFDRLRAVALVLIASIQAELSNSSFRVAGLEWDTHGKRDGDPLPMELTLHLDDVESDDTVLPESLHDSAISLTDTIDESPITLLLGGRIDRVDFYRDKITNAVFVRVVDYKASRHDFSAKSVSEDLNIQLLLYLFTLCSDRNRSLFADENGGIPDAVIPSSAVYMSPDETSRDGEILPCRTGIILNDDNVLAAANQDLDESFLPSVRRDRSRKLTGSGLQSAEDIHNLENLLKQAITETAKDMYEGKADRTPSKNACKYCIMRGSCSLSAE